MNKKFLIALVVIVLLVLWLGTDAVNLITDWFWFEGLALQNIFTTILLSKVVLFLVVGTFVFTVILLNLKIAEKLTKGKTTSIPIGEEGQEINIGENIGKLSLPIAGFLGILTGLVGAESWQIVLKFLNRTPFGQFDPVFGKDISFYIFSLPFLEFILGIIIWSLFISLIGVAIIYVARGTISFGKREEIIYSPRSKGHYKISKSSRVHFSFLLAFIFAALAIKTYFVKIPNILYSQNDLFMGAHYTDIHALLPVYKILAVILLAAFLVSIVNIFKKRTGALFITIGIYIIVFIAGGLLYPALLQKFVVEPNELAKESPYISNNIEATQKAFGLYNVEEKELSGEDSITASDIEENKATIRNVRVWDRGPLLDTFGQIQEIRTYYDFVSIDNDRYEINGNYRQILLSPRELNSESLPNRTFINEHLTFTHGFGITLGPVNEVSKEGLPVLFVKDIPPTSTVENLEIIRPEIYYGELSNNYVVSNTKAKEFDYPSGDENVFAEYKGSGGVPVENILKKLLFSIRFGDLKFLFSNDIVKGSKVMYVRNIKDRAEKALPFLDFDKDSYLVVTKNGRLKWIIDAYTTSNNYPYSQRVRSDNWNGSFNYARNSVKVVIDAYNGDLSAFIADEEDPLIKTYAKIFKNVFKPISEMSDDLKTHIRYPEDIFTIQSALYSTYHMEDPQIFYNKEDQWEIPKISEGRNDPMMRHIIMKLPGEEKEEFILMIPFTPQKKNNMAAWMAARSDGEHYGELVVFSFPKQRLVFGPSQIINRINQDPEISRQISLWDQRGSEVNLGPLLVIPVEESLIYVRPLYLRAQGGNIPELKRVIVAYKNKIVMDETLEGAIRGIFEGETRETTSPTGEIPSNIEERIREALNHYQNALEAQSSGDWASYGEEIKKVGDILNEIR